MMEATGYKALVKKYFLWTGGICLGAAGIFLAFFYLLDPLQFFRRSSDANGPLSANMRAQAAGILNTFDIDSIILGTSMLENTSASEASAKLGGKFFNISLSGGDYGERALLLKRALQKPIKAVIYSLDSYYLTCPTRDNRIPAYLYDDDPLNDIKYYATPASLKRLFQHDWGLTQKDHDRPNAWYHLPVHHDRFGGIQQWVAQKENPQVQETLNTLLPQLASTYAAASRSEVHAPERERLAKQYIDKYILDIIRNHEDTNFYFIFPPYSRIRYAELRRLAPQDFFLHQEIVRYLVDQTKDKQNIHIYGFEDQDFPDDIANYKDTGHYHQKFNSLFLDAIASGSHELTPENVEAYLKKCERKAWDYDIPALNDEVERLMKAAGKEPG